jgi:hypothetical protein
MTMPKSRINQLFGEITFEMDHFRCHILLMVFDQPLRRCALQSAPQHIGKYK